MNKYKIEFVLIDDNVEAYPAGEIKEDLKFTIDTETSFEVEGEIKIEKIKN